MGRTVRKSLLQEFFTDLQMKKSVLLKSEHQKEQLRYFLEHTKYSPYRLPDSQEGSCEKSKVSMFIYDMISLWWRQFKKDHSIKDINRLQGIRLLESDF